MSDPQATIVAACRRYVDAFLAADSGLMAGLFEPLGRLHGAIAGTAWSGGPQDLAEFCDGHPPGRDSGMTAEIAVLGVVGDSAAVRVDVRNYVGLGFTDFFVMQRIDGAWTVVGGAFSSV